MPGSTRMSSGCGQSPAPAWKGLKVLEMHYYDNIFLTSAFAMVMDSVREFQCTAIIQV